MIKIVEKWKNVTERIEPWWTLIGAPLIQEFIFRFLSYQIYLVYGGFYKIGIGSSILFAAIHWYFGKWFVVYSLIWGLILWWVVVGYGFFAVAILHVVLNVIHWRFRILPRKIKK